MQNAKLGNSGLEVSALGLGLHGNELFLRSAQRQAEMTTLSGQPWNAASHSSTPPRSTARS